MATVAAGVYLQDAKNLVTDYARLQNEATELKEVAVAEQDVATFGTVAELINDYANSGGFHPSLNELKIYDSEHKSLINRVEVLAKEVKAFNDKVIGLAPIMFSSKQLDQLNGIGLKDNLLAWHEKHNELSENGLHLSELLVEAKKAADQYTNSMQAASDLIPDNRIFITRWFFSRPDVLSSSPAQGSVVHASLSRSNSMESISTVGANENEEEVAVEQTIVGNKESSDNISLSSSSSRSSVTQEDEDPAPPKSGGSAASDMSFVNVEEEGDAIFDTQ